MANIGYTLMTEQSGPADLVRYATAAEELGFDFLVSSDHYSPWLAEQGHSPNAWVTLGAVANATERVELMTYVTCPTMRYHPAVVAQQAATMQLLSEGRFVLNLGSGESLNEHVVGEGWPSVDVRQSMLEEAITIIRELHTGELVTWEGEYFRVDSARVWDAASVPIGVAISGSEGIERAELPTPASFAAATANATPEQVAESIACGPDLDALAQAVTPYLEAGFTDVAIVQVGDALQDRFLEEAAEPLLERVRAL